MSIIVQKFGGTSVADSKKILAAARKAIRAKMEGHQVVMVVSAMGQNTDVLIDLAKQISDNPPPREMDMLLSTGEQVSVALMAMAIHSLGHEAISLTGAQIGIITDSTHTKARIQSISTDRIHKYLDQGNIVIAAGFQGIDESFNITTLGRGGSDTTAVALAAVLGAVACEIYTDVDGVYTTDPRVMPEARRLAQISYDEMLELASAGAAVMHNRSIEFAKNFSVPVHVRSSFSDVPGTMIVHEPEAPNMAVCGAALSKDEARVTLRGVPDHPGTAHAIFSRIAAKNIPIDMIVQSEGTKGMADMSFSVQRDDLGHALQVMEEAKKELNAEAVTFDDDVAKVSVVGLGMATQPGVAGTMFTALAEKGINIEMITTSEIKISVLVAREFALEALRTVHSAFQLSVPPQDGKKHGEGSHPTPTKLDTASLLAPIGKGRPARTAGKADHRRNHARRNASDDHLRGPGRHPRPGRADFRRTGRGGRGGRYDRAEHRPRQPRRHLRDHQTRRVGKIARRSPRKSPNRLNCPMPTYSAQVAKLSVFGTGIKSHSGVASRMFRALSESQINLELISTSEVRINVVVDGAQGAKALAALKKEFADALVTGNGE